MESEDPKERVRRRHLRAGRRQLDRDQNEQEANARRKASDNPPSRKQARKQARRAANELTRRARSEHDPADPDWTARGESASWQPMRRAKRSTGRIGRTRGDGTLAAVTTVYTAGRIDVVLSEGGSAAATANVPVAAEASLLADQQLAVGDSVRVVRHGERFQAVALEPRRSVLTRSDPSHPKRRLVVAANVDVAVLTVTAAPPPKPGWIDRLLVALADSGIAPCIAANKIDTVTPADRVALERSLSCYREQRIPSVLVSAATGDGLDTLRAELRGQVCVLVGHSGVGKSSLANALDPDGSRSTGPVRGFDGKGRHTTTRSGLRILADGTTLIDTPGVRQFGLGALDPRALIGAFPELERAADHCRFRDCRHLSEPECGVLAAVSDGRVPQARYQSYRRILESLDDAADDGPTSTAMR